MMVNTEIPLQDPYEQIKIGADLIDKNYFNTPTSDLNYPQFNSKGLLLYYLQYYIRYSQALEERIRDLEDKLPME